MDCQYVEIIHSFNVYSIVNTTIHQTELMNVDIAQSVRLCCHIHVQVHPGNYQFEIIFSDSNNFSLNHQRSFVCDL